MQNDDPAPDGAEELSPRRDTNGVPETGSVVSGSFAPPGENAWMVNHGLRGDGCALAPLHPWLHSGAPSGAKTNWVAGKARTMG